MAAFGEVLGDDPGQGDLLEAERPIEITPTLLQIPTALGMRRRGP